MSALQKLFQRKTLTILGVNSGTSIDGLDLSLVRIKQPRNMRSARLQITELARREVSYPADLHDELLRLATDKSISPERLALLDEAFGAFMGNSCRTFIKRCAKRGLKVDCIASHGQTVRHHPHLKTIAGYPVRATLQIGSPERIAATTKTVVVSHFRQADTALGGEGAPITTTAVYHCLCNAKESRLIVNLGGIANFFYLPAGMRASDTLAEDIGPGNLLLDQITQSLFAMPYDTRGALAGSGTVNSRLLQTLMKHNFFRVETSRPLSTGREEYGNKAVRKILKHAESLSLDNNSVLTTVTELVALTIAKRLEPMLSADRRLRGIYLTGGGARNTFLVKRIRANISREVAQKSRDSRNHTRYFVHSIKTLGVNPDAFEATCYATLGWMCLQGIPAGRVTGQQLSGKRAPQLPILGRIIQPPWQR